MRFAIIIVLLAAGWIAKLADQQILMGICFGAAIALVTFWVAIGRR